ncbi:MAG: heparinase II/III family protein [Candidatus Cryptobacteroides sp.]
MKKVILAIATLSATLTIHAQELRTEVFDMLDLGRKGLEQVKASHEAGDDAAAATALLEYYRGRKDICTPEIQNVSKVKINKEQQKWADEALEHRFFSHKGYQPSYFYGDDIDWKYWPVQDNELRWQLHRHKWFMPMGLAYRTSGDEKYAIEWTKEYIDWIRKNPYVKISKEEYEITQDSQLKADAENARYAWRPLEVSHRLQDQCLQFQLFIDSPAFTPEFLTEFLVNYHRHADHIINNYSKQGNHLLFEAQRMLYAGSFFPEFKEAETWRQSGVKVLNTEIDKQVLPDGGQYELCPHYHLAAIEIFYKALQIADLNHFRNEFPQSYLDKVEDMIMFYINIMYPDYTNPCFSDAKITKKNTMIGHFKKWTKVFPDNQVIKYFATEGAEGQLPDYLSKGFEDTGYFVFRNGWGEDALQMVVKAGPAGEWHAQPDFGTFEMWYNGKCLFQDSGSYVYEGKDPEIMEWRKWFRATSHHNTLVMDDKDVDKVASRTLLWKEDGDVQILVTEHPSYKNLTHRRSIFFVDGQYFVIVDEAVGKMKGWVNLHYQMPRGDVPNSRDDMHFHTNFEEGSNFYLQCFCDDMEKMQMKKEKGWQSSDYMKKVQRIDASFKQKKESDDPVRFITVIYPKQKAGEESVSAKFTDKGFSDKGLSVQVKVGKNKKKTLSYTL